MKRIFPVILCTALLFAGCGESAVSETPSEASTAPSVNATVPENQEQFTDRDQRTEYETNTATLTFTGDQVTGDTDSVRIAESTVTISDEGTFILQGSYTGSIVVDCDKTAKPQLVLKDFCATGTQTAPLYICQAGKVFVTLEGDNTLSAPDSFIQVDDNNVDGAVFSKADLTFNGGGSLTLNCSAGHGIVAKDDLAICGGSYTVNCAGHGVQANDSVRISQSTWQITAGKDGVHAENDEDATLGYVYIEAGDFHITAEGDGISAGAWMQILDGTYEIVTGGGSENGTKASSDNYGGFMGGHGGGGRPGGFGGGMGGFQSTETDRDSTSMKGIKSAGELKLQGGTFTMDCADDAIHSNLKITVSGGVYNIATGDDGFHADENLTVESGTILVSESYEGLEGQEISILGGDIKLTCSDDGINAAGGNDQSGFGGREGMFGGGREGMFGGGSGGMGGSSNGTITISGGTVYMNASGDGIDANGSLTISGGHVTVCGPTRGDTSVLDYDNYATITGGTFIGTGSQMMAQSFTESSQGVVAVSMGGNLTAGTAIVLSDSHGNTLVEYSPALDFAIVILSTPDMVKGESYTITVGDISGTFEAS